MEAVGILGFVLSVFGLVSFIKLRKLEEILKDKDILPKDY